MMINKVSMPINPICIHRKIENQTQAKTCPFCCFYRGTTHDKRIFTPYPAVELDQKCSMWWRSNATTRRNEALWSLVMLQHCLKDNCLVVRGITITMRDMMAFGTN